MSLPPADIYETLATTSWCSPRCQVSLSMGLTSRLERGVLTIRGRSAPNDHPGYQRVYSEYAVATTKGSSPFSENIDRERIEATLKDGVMHLVLPKAETAKARKIELKSG